ncbi:MAG: peptidase S41, partial [Variovorax sp.]
MPSGALAQRCAVPRVGTDPATGRDYLDRQGSLAEEKAWVRAWIDETYLWYDEVPTTLSAADYDTPQVYFGVLKTPLTTASGKPKDRFHFTIDTATYRALQQSIEPNYGLEFAYLARTAPRDIRVAYTEPGSSAAEQGVQRGAQVLEIDGVDAVNGKDTNTLNAGLAPAKSGEAHRFKLRARDGSVLAVTLTASNATRTPVQNVR